MAFSTAPIISAAAASGAALKRLSDRMTEDMKKRERENYIFTIQISCTFPSWYYHASLDSIIKIPTHAVRSSYTFTPKMSRKEIKEEIWKTEETLIQTYEEAIMRRYGVKYDRCLTRKIEYKLEVEKK